MASFEVTIDVDAARPLGAYRPIWNWVGYDEPNYTYTENGRKLLRELAALSPEPVRVRTHNLLTSGDGIPALKWGSTNAYREHRRPHRSAADAAAAGRVAAASRLVTPARASR